MRIHACKSYLYCINTGSNSAKEWVEPLNAPANHTLSMSDPSTAEKDSFW